MKVAYARVSTHTQAENTLAEDASALDQQIARLKEHSPDRLLSDVDSGLDQNRPAYSALLDLIKSGQVSQVIVTRLDRLNRRLIGLMELFELAESCGVSITALDEQIDTSSSIGKFYIRLIGNLAQMESERISERVKHGWNHLRDNNKPVNPPFGYCIQNNKLVLDDTEVIGTIRNKTIYSYSQMARLYIRFFLSCQSLSGTLKLFNEHFGLSTLNSNRTNNRRRFGFSSHEGLKRWLTSPVLLGHLCYNRTTTVPLSGGRSRIHNPQHRWDIRYDTHPDQALLSYTQRANIDSILERNKTNHGFISTRRIHPSAGLVYCSVCGARMVSSSAKKRVTKSRPNREYTYYFKCSQNRFGLCSSTKYIRTDLLHPLMLKACRDELIKLVSSTTLPTFDHTAVDDEISKLQQQLHGLEQLGFNPAFEHAKRSLEHQIKILQQQADNRLVNLFTEDDRVSKFLKLANRYINLPSDQLDHHDLNDLFYFFIDKVWVRNGQIERIDMKSIN